MTDAITSLPTPRQPIGARSATAAFRRAPAVVVPLRPVPSDEARAPEPERLAAALARWYVEALAGRRDPRALRDLLTPTVEQRVRCAVTREAARRRAGRPAQAAVVEVRSCRVVQVTDRWEATVVVDDGTRATAVVATLHERTSGWTVSELARPEDGVPALRPPLLR